MPVDFDQQLPPDDELTFIAQGQVFHMVLAAPSVLASIEDEDDENLTAQEATDRLVARIGQLLDSGDQTRWLEMAKAEQLPYRQVRAIWDWAWETQTGRPTQQPSASAGGRGSTEATSEVSAARTARAAARSRPRGRR